MKFWQRLKNLWLISGLNLEEAPTLAKKIKNLLSSSKATIVDMEDPLNRDLGENQ